MIITLLASVFIFLGIVTVFHGFEIENVSVGGVILSSRIFIPIPVAIVFFEEIYPIIVYIGIVIIIIGNVLVSWKQ